MLRMSNLEESLFFFTEKLGLKEVRRYENEKGRFTLIFLAANEDVKEKVDAPLIELTYNWPNEDGLVEKLKDGRNFGHIAFSVENIYKTCEDLVEKGVIINRPLRDGYMAFVRSPDNISVEILQKGSALEPIEPWRSMSNVGFW